MNALGRVAESESPRVGGQRFWLDLESGRSRNLKQLWSRKKCPTPKKNIYININVLVHFTWVKLIINISLLLTGFAILGCLAAIYILLDYP